MKKNDKKSINNILLKIKIMIMIIMIIIITTKMIEKEKAITYYYSTETS